MAENSKAEYMAELIAKFTKLVESLGPGERLSIKIVRAPKRAKAAAGPRAASRKSTRKTAVKPRAKG